MEAELNEETAVWAVRAMWFGAGALLMDSMCFISEHYLDIPEMNLPGAVLVGITGVIYTVLAVKWDEQLINQIKERK